MSIYVLLSSSSILSASYTPINALSPPAVTLSICHWLLRLRLLRWELCFCPTLFYCMAGVVLLPYGVMLAAHRAPAGGVKLSISNGCLYSCHPCSCLSYRPCLREINFNGWVLSQLNKLDPELIALGLTPYLLLFIEPKEGRRGDLHRCIRNFPTSNLILLGRLNIRSPSRLVYRSKFWSRFSKE